MSKFIEVENSYKIKTLINLDHVHQIMDQSKSMGGTAILMTGEVIGTAESYTDVIEKIKRAS